VTLLARKLQKAEIIRYSRGHIEILDRVRLEHASCECYHNIKRRVSDAYRACNVHRPLTVQYSLAPGLSPRL
jgi:hypothetical protein